MTTETTALDWSADNCSIGRTLSVIGEKWTLLVLREVFQGLLRFEDMRVRTGIPRQVLSERLTRLVDEGLLRKVPYREPGQRERSEYRLTEKGLDLYPTLVALLAWGDKYLAGPEGPSLELVHRDCGSPVHLDLQCAAGHTGLGVREVGSRPGPGARRRAG